MQGGNAAIACKQCSTAHGALSRIGMRARHVSPDVRRTEYVLARLELNSLSCAFVEVLVADWAETYIRDFGWVWTKDVNAHESHCCTVNISDKSVSLANDGIENIDECSH